MQTLRRTFGSHLAIKKKPILTIARLMGNSPEVAEKHYIGLSDAHLEKEIQGLYDESEVSSLVSSGGAATKQSKQEVVDSVIIAPVAQ